MTLDVLTETCCHLTALTVTPLFLECFITNERREHNVNAHSNPYNEAFMVIDSSVMALEGQPIMSSVNVLSKYSCSFLVLITFMCLKMNGRVIHDTVMACTWYSVVRSCEISVSKLLSILWYPTFLSLYICASWFNQHFINYNKI